MPATRTADLTAHALDWAVAKCQGRTVRHKPMGPQGGHGWWVWEETPSGHGVTVSKYAIYLSVGKQYSPSTNWAQGGPIIESERITLRGDTRGGNWVAFLEGARVTARMEGPTALVAAMRCYVAHRLGATVDIPEELTRTATPQPTGERPCQP